VVTLLLFCLTCRCISEILFFIFERQGNKTAVPTLFYYLIQLKNTHKDGALYKINSNPRISFPIKNNFVLISKRVKTFAHFNSFLSLSSFIFVRRHSRTRRTVMTSLLNFLPTQQFAASRTNKNTHTQNSLPLLRGWWW
jgi:hypothetical protein